MTPRNTLIGAILMMAISWLAIAGGIFSDMRFSELPPQVAPICAIISVISPFVAFLALREVMRQRKEKC